MFDDITTLSAETASGPARRRLGELLDELRATVEPLLAALDVHQARIAELEEGSTAQADQLVVLARDLRTQLEVASRFKAQAQQASELKQRLKEKESRLQKLGAELEEKLDDIRRLRADLRQLEAELVDRDTQIDRLRAEGRQQQERIESLAARLEELEEAVEHTGSRRYQFDTLREGIATSRNYVERLRADLDRIAELSGLLTAEAEQGQGSSGGNGPRHTPPTTPELTVVDTVVLDAAPGQDEQIDGPFERTRPFMQGVKG